MRLFRDVYWGGVNRWLTVGPLALGCCNRTGEIPYREWTVRLVWSKRCRHRWEPFELSPSWVGDERCRKCGYSRSTHRRPA